jgi:hypothetical protein
VFGHESETGVCGMPVLLLTAFPNNFEEKYADTIGGEES